MLDIISVEIAIQFRGLLGFSVHLVFISAVNISLKSLLELKRVSRKCVTDSELASVGCLSIVYCAAFC